MKLNILIVGVGGQGTLLASKILGNFAQLIGMDCKLSEVHGMAQRGGSVVTFVRIAEKVFSPIIDRKQADLILAFEELEALRWAEYIKDGGKIVVSKQNLFPLPCSIGKQEYPNDIYERLAGYNASVHSIDALAVAKRAGSLRTVNIAILGFTAALLGLDKRIFIEAIKKSVAEKTLETNLKAFEEGYKS